MSEETEGFGPFGDVEPVGTGHSRIWTWVRLFLIFIAAVFIPVAIRGWQEFYNGFGENKPPKIEIIKPPLGLGIEPLELNIAVSDDQSGVDEVIVRAEQGGETKDLLRKSYPDKLQQDRIKVAIPGVQSGFHEGELRIIILAFDRSFWSNSARASFVLHVDYQRPQIELISSQHNAVRGGVELVFYRVPGDGKIFTGVMAGSQIFPAFPAAKLDKDFSSLADVYFAFFAVPLDFQEQEGMRILARDLVGNTATAGFFYRIKEWPKQRVEKEIPAEFVGARLTALYRTFEEQKSRRMGAASGAGEESEAVDRLRLLLGEARETAAEDLKQIFARPKAERFWTGYFGRPAGKPASPPFGWRVRYLYLGEGVGEVPVDGVEFATAGGSPVRASNNGVVIYADDLGYYGKTVIVDHGFGLSTMYSHLESIAHLEGTRLAAGEVLGTSGQTGFALKGAIGYEIRLHGVPVRPEEWWDKLWISDHIEAKIAEMKGRLGLKSQKTLP